MSRAVLSTLTAATFLTLAPAAARAQTISIRPAGAASAPALLPAGASKETPEQAAERAGRQAEGPMYWIRMNAQKAAEEKSARPAPPPGAAAARATPAPAPSPAQAQAANPLGASAAAAPSAGVTPPQLPVASASTTALPPAGAGNGGAPNTARPAPVEQAVPEPRAITASAAASTPLAGGDGSGPLASALPTQNIAPPPRPAEEPVPDQPLQLVAGNEPRFPDALMRRLRKGSVNMRVDVGTDGKVIQVAVVNSSHPRLEQAAIEAAQGMRFQPIRKPASGEVNFSFDLDS